MDLILAEFGVHAKALSWLETYLEAPTQRVKMDDAISETIPLTCGVPQGSVLGPVLFTIYTMPMQRIIRKHGVVYHKYADDTQLYVTRGGSRAGGLGGARQLTRRHTIPSPHTRTHSRARAHTHTPRTFFYQHIGLTCIFLDS